MSKIRAGRYQKSFFRPEDLNLFIDDLWPHFEEARFHFKTGVWTPAELTADFMLRIWKKARPKSWSNGPRSSLKQVPANEALTILQTTRLRGIPPEAQNALVEWHTGDWALDLCFGIPSSSALLAHQCRGKRFVSVLTKTKQEFLNGGEDRDSFSFALHDLIHAWHFFNDPEHFAKQVWFSRWMQTFWPTLESIRGHVVFSQMEYLVSDMNTHVIHSLKCLKSILKTRPDLLEICLKDQGEAFVEDFSKLNTPAEQDETRRRLDQTILDYLRDSNSVHLA